MPRADYDRPQEDSEGPVQMGNLDGLGDIPPPARQEVVSPSQSAFGFRAYEDEGEDDEGEAPPEVEDDFEDEGEDGEDDWDTVRQRCLLVCLWLRQIAAARTLVSHELVRVRR